METEIDANTLVSENFKWDESLDGFAMKSHEVIKAFTMTEIEALKRLVEEHKLHQLGAFGFIVERACEHMFFSRSDIEAVRPVAREDADMAAYVFMISFASEKIAKDAIGMLIKCNVHKACNFIGHAAWSENEDELNHILKQLPKLKDNQGTKFSLEGNGMPAKLNFIAEVVESHFRLWVSWTIHDNIAAGMKDNAKMEVVRALTGAAIATECIGETSFSSAANDS